MKQNREHYIFRISSTIDKIGYAGFVQFGTIWILGLFIKDDINQGGRGFCQKMILLNKLI